MKKTFTILIAALAAILMMAQPMKVMGQTKGTVDDVLVATSFTATSTTYTDFTGVTFDSDAVYAGNSAKTSGGAIQLRSSKNSGIVSTTSGGTVHSVAVVVESGTKTLDIYGKNTAYEAASDLYDNEKKGTKIGSISATGTVNLGNYVDDYQYIGLRSSSGALYLTSITITWTTSGGGTTPTNYTLTYSAYPAAGGTVTVNNSTTGTASVAQNTVANISAAANEGYVFNGWEKVSGEGSFGNASNATTTFTMGSSDATIRANFNQAATYTVTFDAGVGTFVGNDAFPNTTNQKAAGTYLLPSATPAEGYNFDGWVVSGSNIARTGKYTVSGAVSFTASYSQFAGQTTTFDFEDSGAHNNGSNNYTNAHNYSQNNANIYMMYFDAISNNSISGSYLARGRVKDGTTNSPVMIIGPITITNQTITGIQFKTKGPDLITETFATSTDGTNYTDQLVFTCNTSTEIKTKGLSITGTNLYLKWTGAVSSTVSDNKDFDIDDIVITYTVVSYTPTVALNNNSYGTLAGPTNDVYTVTPNPSYKIVGYTKTNNVTVEQLTGDAFSASTYRIIATAANQTVTFNLAQRTGTTVTLHDGLNGSTTTNVDTYKDATLADVIESHTIAPVNGWTALGWVKSYTSGDPTLITTTEAVGETTNLYAVYMKGSNRFDLINNTNALEADGVYMICGFYSNKYYLMNDKNNDNTTMGITDDIAVDNNSFDYSAGKKFVLGGNGTNGYTFYDGNNYLTGTSTTSTLTLGKQTDYSIWSISFSDNIAQIKNIENTTSTNTYYVSYYQGKFNCYKNTNTVYLFKQMTNDLQYSIAPTAELCHVYYDANGATSGNVPEDNTGYNPNTNVTILGNTGTLAKTGYTWSGWCLNAEGIGTVYGPGYTTTYTLPENTMFYAKWVVNSHDWSTDLTNAVSGTTAQLKVNNAVVAANTQIAYGTEVTVEVTVPNGYIYNISVNNGSVSVTNYKFTMPDEDVTIAVTTQVNPYLTATLSSSNMASMTLAEETDPLAYGKLKYTTVNGFYWETNGQQANATGTTNRLGMIQLRDRTKTENSYIKLPVFDGKIESVVLTVTNGSAEASDGAVCKATFNFQTNNAIDGEIIIQGGNSTSGTSEVTLDLSEKYCNTGYIKINNSSNAARIWNITVTYLPYDNFTDLDPTAPMPTLVAGDNYAVPSNMSTTDLTIPATAGIVVKSGATLTVTGTLTNNGTAANLVIEDGGQLIIPSTGSKTDVKATFQKNITHYSSTKDNYYLIANPTTDVIDPEDVDEMVEDYVEYDYDLYYFDEEQTGEEWRNYRQVAFDLVNGKGYLYAKSSDITLEFPGTVPPGTTADITLSKLGSGTYAGFNLVGNPLSNNVATMKIVEDEEEKSCSYYKVNSDNGVFAVSTAPITVGEAFMVQAPSNGAVLKLNQGVAKGEDGFNNEVIRLEVSNSKFTDVAYVYFGNHLPLTKINHLNDEAPMLYIHNENSDRAVEVYNNRGEVKSINVNFEAKTMGTYTISAKMVKGEIKYMHLYDRLTGIDTDLLVDDYSFIGTKDDQSGRFILNLESVDDNGSSTGSETFAYQSGDNIIVNGEGTLAVYDVTGRKVMATTINGVETINGLNSGVYIFRIIGETLRTQKIVVR